MRHQFTDHSLVTGWGKLMFKPGHKKKPGIIIQ
jgi:hypothetical protein